MVLTMVPAVMACGAETQIGDIQVTAVEVRLKLQVNPHLNGGQNC